MNDAEAGWVAGLLEGEGYFFATEKDGTFQAIPVPIHNGRSYLATLLKTVK